MSWAGVVVAAWLIEPLFGSDLVRPMPEARASALWEEAAEGLRRVSIAPMARAAS